MLADLYNARSVRLMLNGEGMDRYIDIFHRNAADDANAAELLLLPGWEGNMNVKWLRRIKATEEPTHTKDETSKYTDLLPDGKALLYAVPDGLIRFDLANTSGDRWLTTQDLGVTKSPMILAGSTIYFATDKPAFVRVGMPAP